ncbi:MAG: zinc ribbon domain-containing protein [Terriglobia bacterium]
MLRVVESLHLVLLCALVFAIAAPLVAGAQAGEVSLESLKVSIWPEYDRADTALIMFRGELKEGTDLPAKVTFVYPKRAQLSATSSVDEKGEFQYDKEWSSKEIVEKGDSVELTYNVYHPRFQFELYDPVSTSTADRSHSFPLEQAMDTEGLTVEIQEPRGATDFALSPETDKKNRDPQGFTFYTYELDAASSGDKNTFGIKYTKSTNEPSVADQTQPVTGTTGTKTNPWIIGGVILGMIAIPTLFYFIARGQPASATAQGARGKARKGKAGRFCSNCGTRLTGNVKFCPSCGKKA